MCVFCQAAEMVSYGEKIQVVGDSTCDKKRDRKKQEKKKSTRKTEPSEQLRCQY